MAEDMYLVSYGVLRGFIGGVLSRFGVTASDMTLDILAVVLGYYLKTQPGWKGVVGKVLYIGGLVSIGLEIGESTGRNVASELFRALPMQQTAGSVGARQTVGAVVF